MRLQRNVAEIVPKVLSKNSGGEGEFRSKRTKAWRAPGREAKVKRDHPRDRKLKGGQLKAGKKKHLYPKTVWRKKKKGCLGLCKSGWKAEGKRS